MKVIACLTMIVLLSGAAMAQSPAAPNSVYFEVAGNSLAFSINYDRLFAGSLGGRVGVGYLSAFGIPVMATFPMMVHYLIGSGSSKLELGLGACAILQSENQSFSIATGDDEFEGNGILGTAAVGYRYQRAEGGIVFRVGLTPFFGKYVRYTQKYHPEYVVDKEDVYRFALLGGISVGYAF